MLCNKKYFCHVLKISLITIIGIFYSPFLIAQSYTHNDFVQIYKWLTQADDEAVTGSLDTAMKYTRLALQVSKEKNVTGEGFAKLKIADILGQQENRLI